MINNQEFKFRCSEYYFGAIYLTHVDDGFGNLWERAGYYYELYPDKPMIHSRMMKMGNAWYFDTIQSSYFDKI